ncbi:Gmad2 immunoglobulin-like domain-containing protein [Desulfoscipio gibsoniae]|uniref:Sporulation/spore germination protein,spore germination protein, immunogloblin-like domain-containing n=1 Tax=Desulfoscipio gibsoniae DSM 7213 TaxID=767817 RepID=R4KNH8_9FIRM|nr:Gmad2 immunoglobulin-like domain-containing protein [Desulfoscipio gibsoniae]AGL03117.1 sporulation/spore germination protein,spore germination protein, immunogloblin-like domain-containing [Desulfoscipio gibsoniae DSM 7213]
MHSLGKLTLVKLLVVLLLILSAGCSTSSNEQTDNQNKNADQQDKVAEQQEQTPDINLPVYFVKYTADGAYLVREVHTVSYTKQVANAAMQELINDEKSILPSGTKILGINIEKGLATVNFSKEVLNNTNVGSAGEQLGIQSIVNTLTEFPNIEKVAFQVDGRADGRAQDWWGHVGLYEQPFTQDCSMVYEPAIWVTHPTPHQVICVPLLVKGSAMVFEGAVNARLLDSSGEILAESYTTAKSGAPERGDFEMSIKFDPPSDGEGVLEVYQVSPQDGSPQDIVSIPVQWP